MTTLSETQAHAPRFMHLRAYLAGTGATGALVAGAIIVFLSLATYVAFNGIPFGGSAANSGNATLGVQTSGTPAGAAAALRAAPGAVAAAPVPGAAVGAGGPTAGVPGGGAGAPAPSGGFTTDDGTTPTGSTPPGSTPTGDGGGGTVTQPCSTCTSPGVVTNTLNQVDNTTNQDLSDGTIGDVAGTVDDTVTGTLNNVGGNAGDPSLGNDVNDTVNGTVNDTVDKLPGPLGK